MPSSAIINKFDQITSDGTNFTLTYDVLFIGSAFTGLQDSASISTTIYGVVANPQTIRDAVISDINAKVELILGTPLILDSIVIPHLRTGDISSGLIPPGGAAGNVLKKSFSDTDFMTNWYEPGPFTFAFSKSGAPTPTGVIPFRFLVRRAITITSFHIALNTPITGGTLTVDLDRATAANPATMTSLYTTQGNRPSITSTTAYSAVNGLPDTTSIPAGHFLQPRIAVAPTGGENLSVFIEYTIAEGI